MTRPRLRGVACRERWFRRTRRGFLRELRGKPNRTHPRDTIAQKLPPRRLLQRLELEFALKYFVIQFVAISSRFSSTPATAERRIFIRFGRHVVVQLGQPLEFGGFCLAAGRSQETVFQLGW